MQSKRFLSDAYMVMHYKSQVLPFIEYRTPGIYHACSSALRAVDAVQERLLGNLGVSDVEALFHFNLASLCARMDIAMLGVIHRSVIGLGPEQFNQFFVRDRGAPRGQSRQVAGRHTKQLVDARGRQFSEQLRRSALGLVAVYNLFPQVVVDSMTVSSFQGQFQDMLRNNALQESDWQMWFSPRVPLYNHHLSR